VTARLPWYLRCRFHINWVAEFELSEFLPASEAGGWSGKAPRRASYSATAPVKTDFN
jgi:hypothetical protein